MKPFEAVLSRKVFIQKRVPSTMLIIVSDFDGVVPQRHGCIYKVVESYCDMAGAGEDHRLGQSLWTRPLMVALKPQRNRISGKFRADAGDVVEVVQVDCSIIYDHLGESIDGEVLQHEPVVAQQRASSTSAFHQSWSFDAGGRKERDPGLSPG